MLSILRAVADKISLVCVHVLYLEEEINCYLSRTLTPSGKLLTIVELYILSDKK